MDPVPESFTIMVIDDEEIVRDLVAELLQMSGHRVIAVPGGEDALAMVRAAQPNLILVDYHMPGMTGLEVVRRLKADDETSRIPVVAMTSATGRDANELSRAGCIAFIPKPFEPTAFRHLVGDILRATVGRKRRAE